MKKILKIKVTKEMIDEVNEVRTKVGFEPTQTKIGDEFHVLIK